ncbi:hypothetical protein J6590_078199 [Homalodisca vitripennis]|nr:hypothetical protein J6590_078199 [Homalodisca vitripennis]
MSKAGIYDYKPVLKAHDVVNTAQYRIRKEGFTVSQLGCSNASPLRLKRSFVCLQTPSIHNVTHKRPQTAVVADRLKCLQTHSSCTHKVTDNKPQTAATLYIGKQLMVLVYSKSSG